MEARLFDPENPPPWTTPAWYAGRDAAPHLEQEGHHQRLEVSAQLVRVALAGQGTERVLDLGAGDGGLLSLIKRHDPDVDVWGYDLQQTNVDAARLRGVDVQLRDVVADWWPDRPGDPPDADVVVATEFLEHLLDPHEFVRRVRDYGARFLVASSPYTETKDSHYEFHTWAWDLPGYRALLEGNGWRVLEQRLAWISQVLLAERST